MSNNKEVVEKGSRGSRISWEIVLSDELPPIDLCTAVFCLAITDDRKIVLARSKRGWGLLGGHIEDGETLDDALTRESQEEGGFTPSSPRVFAHRKATAKSPIINQDRARMYPFPESYIVYYWSTTDSPIVQPTGSEIIETSSFSLEDTLSLNTRDQLLIESGYETYLKQQ